MYRILKCTLHNMTCLKSLFSVLFTSLINIVRHLLTIMLNSLWFNRVMTLVARELCSGANLYMGLGGIIQEFLQFFRKFKL